MNDEEDLSWLTDEIRARGLETLTALFATASVCITTFDRQGVVLAINDYTLAFGGHVPEHYCGLNLVEHPILKRLGWSQLVSRALAGERVEATDTRWITLFSGEERWVDVTVTPVVVGGAVVGGVGCLIDATPKHRALAREVALRHQMKELVLYMTRDMARPIESLRAHTGDPALGDTVSHLATLLEDLREFLEVGSVQPRRAKVSLSEALLAAGSADRADADVHVYGDARMLRRALANIVSFASRSGGGRHTLVRRDGRVVLTVEVGGSSPLLKALLDASSLSAAEAAGADASVAAARWMVELMGGTLRASDSGQGLELDLPSADPSAYDF